MSKEKKIPYKFWHETSEKCRKLWEDPSDREIIAVLEFNCADVELQIECGDDYKEVNLFACRNWEDTGWESDDYVGSDVCKRVSNMTSWQEIENFMYETLVQYCKENHIDYAKGFTGNLEPVTNRCAEIDNSDDAKKMSVEKEIRVRQFSADICELFEDLLDRHNITIPDEDREGDESEARLFGTTYYDLEDDVTGLLLDLIAEVKKNPAAKINSEEY